MPTESESSEVGPRNLHFLKSSPCGTGAAGLLQGGWEHWVVEMVRIQLQRPLQKGSESVSALDRPNRHCGNAFIASACIVPAAVPNVFVSSESVTKAQGRGTTNTWKLNEHYLTSLLAGEMTSTMVVCLWSKHSKNTNLLKLKIWIA